MKKWIIGLVVLIISLFACLMIGIAIEWLLYIIMEEASILVLFGLIVLLLFSAFNYENY